MTGVILGRDNRLREWPSLLVYRQILSCAFSLWTFFSVFIFSFISIHSAFNKSIRVDGCVRNKATIRTTSIACNAYCCCDAEEFPSVHPGTHPTPTVRTYEHTRKPNRALLPLDTKQLKRKINKLKKNHALCLDCVFSCQFRLGIFPFPHCLMQFDDVITNAPSIFFFNFLALLIQSYETDARILPIRPFYASFYYYCSICMAAVILLAESESDQAKKKIPA